MAELEFKGWIESEHLPYAWLLGDLVAEYAASKEGLPLLTKRQAVFTSIDGENDMSKTWSMVGIQLLPLDECDGFAAWCRERNIGVEFSGRIEKSGLSWPSSARIEVSDNNHFLCMSVMRHG